ncbi:MAG: hypothetical protein ACI4KF_04315 [Huintestinicola sp.]
MDVILPKRIKVMTCISVLLSALCILLTAYFTVFQKKLVHSVNVFYDAVEQADYVIPASGIVYTILAFALIIIGVWTFLGNASSKASKTSVILWIALFIGADIAHTVQLNHFIDNIHSGGSYTWMLEPLCHLISGASEILLSVSAVLVSAAADTADYVKNGRKSGTYAVRISMGAYAAYAAAVLAVMFFSQEIPVILPNVIGFIISTVIICIAMVFSQKGKDGIASLAVINGVFSASVIFGYLSNNYQLYYIASSGAGTYSYFTDVSGLCGSLLILYYIGTVIAAVSASRNCINNMNRVLYYANR